ncbi:MAG: hypothetical protein ICV69_06500 [Thermoleophilaceae bacterium]|nr:hypothetical protein [Thermoleophilaceae bacterium]
MAEALRRALRAFRALNAEQKAAAVAALLLVASTFGPFSFVEAAEILVALGVLALLFARAEGKRFHLPFGDGTVIAAAGIWAGLLIVVRLFDRSLGQNLLALACAAILFLAGTRERAKRPADDLPPEHTTEPIRESEPGGGEATPIREGEPGVGAGAPRGEGGAAARAAAGEAGDAPTSSGGATDPAAPAPAGDAGTAARARGGDAGAAAGTGGRDAGAAAPSPEDDTEPLPPPEFRV